MLTEHVEIWSIDPPKKLSTSRLAIGQHGLPVILNQYPSTEVWMLPSAWQVRPLKGSTAGPLYSAWDLIWNLIEELAITQREADTDDRDRAQQRESDDIEAYKRDAETKGER